MIIVIVVVIVMVDMIMSVAKTMHLDHCLFMI